MLALKPPYSPGNELHAKCAHVFKDAYPITFARVEQGIPRSSIKLKEKNLIISALLKSFPYLPHKGRSAWRFIAFLLTIGYGERAYSVHRRENS